MLFNIKDETTILALNLESSHAGRADTTTPVSAPMTSKRPIITGAGTLSPSLMATQEITQPANMKMPSPARLNLFTAYMKQKQSPVKVNGIARLMILPTLLTDENGPSTNCWII